MRESLKKLDEIFSIKNVSKASLILNLTSIVVGIIYLAIPMVNIWWNIFGIVILITFFGNILLVYLNSVKLNTTTKLGHRLNIVGYFYLIFIIFAMGFIGAGNFFIMSSYSSVQADLRRSYWWIYAGYFGVLLIGLVLAFLDFKNLDNREVWDLSSIGDREQSKGGLIIKKILRGLLGLICVLTLLLGSFFVLITLFSSVLGVSDPSAMNALDLTNLDAETIFRGAVGVIGMVVTQAGIFFCFTFLATTVLLLKVKNRKKSPKTYYATALIGLTISGVMIVPLCLTPQFVISAEISFAEAFGADWRDKIDPEIERNYFMSTQFSLPGYFLGIPPKDCDYKADVLFMNGSLSTNFPVDENITLRFDVYWPKGSRTGLPGKNAILIFIHGGGWAKGDKGGLRIIWNKYFAAQGYVVYDIQYGLQSRSWSEGTRLDAGLETVKGNFSINDMVRHVGNFTQYISDPANAYSASAVSGDLSAVFTNGGSAGGHLTCATALAIASGEYIGWFGPNVTIKGYIPLYPGNCLPSLVGIPGEARLICPDQLVKANSPPCLVFHGTGDGLCNPKIAQDFKDAYTNVDNQKCAVLWAPLAGHGGDAYFTGYYGQILLYYMERFMYLCVNDFI